MLCFWRKMKRVEQIFSFLFLFIPSALKGFDCGDQVWNKHRRVNKRSVLMRGKETKIATVIKIENNPKSDPWQRIWNYFTRVYGSDQEKIKSMDNRSNTKIILKGDCGSLCINSVSKTSWQGNQKDQHIYFEIKLCIHFSVSRSDIFYIFTGIVYFGQQIR